MLAERYGPTLTALVFAHEFGHAIQHRLHLDSGDQRASHRPRVAGRLRGGRVRGQRAGRPRAALPHRRERARPCPRRLLPDPRLDAGHPGRRHPRQRFRPAQRPAAGHRARRAVLLQLRLPARPHLHRARLRRPQRLLRPGQRAARSRARREGHRARPQPVLAAQRRPGRHELPARPSWPRRRIRRARPPTRSSSATARTTTPSTTARASPAARTSASPTSSSTRPTRPCDCSSDQPGDYALGFVLAVAWGDGRAVTVLPRFARRRGRAAVGDLLRAGAYSADINRANTDAAHTFVLSPPDMDEATSAVLSLVDLHSAFGARGDDRTGPHPVLRHRLRRRPGRLPLTASLRSSPGAR